MTYRFKYGARSTSECCRDCTDRHEGCHNVDKCERWREDMAARQRVKDNKKKACFEAEVACDSVDRHRKRRR